MSQRDRDRDRRALPPAPPRPRDAREPEARDPRGTREVSIREKREPPRGRDGGFPERHRPHISRSPMGRQELPGPPRTATPTKGTTPVPSSKPSSVVAELMRAAKERARGAAAETAPGSDAQEEGEVLADELAGPKRKHSPIVWRGGDTKRPALGMFQEVAKFRMLQAQAAEEGEDADPYMKPSPSHSGASDATPPGAFIGSVPGAGMDTDPDGPTDSAAAAKVSKWQMLEMDDPGEVPRRQEVLSGKGRLDDGSHSPEEDGEGDRALREGSLELAEGDVGGGRSTSPDTHSAPLGARDTAGDRSLEAAAKRAPSKLPARAGGLAGQLACRNVDVYSKIYKINEGTYGVVHKARSKDTGEIVALKRIKMEKETNGFPITSIREINILLNFHHPNIVNVHEVVVGSGPDQIYMVMEYVDHDLKSLMSERMAARSFSVAEVKCLMQQMLAGVEYLHRNWVIHRDLKTSNILYSNKGELKICDFGLSRQYGSPLQTYTQPVVTLWYRAPELLVDGGDGRGGRTRYSTALDMWSVGCIMGELLTGKPLMAGKTEIEQFLKQCELLGTPTEATWEGITKMAKVVMKPMPSQLHKSFTSAFGTGAMLTEAGLDLLSSLLAWDPKRRISAKDALEHRWFSPSELPRPTPRHLMPTFKADKNGPLRQSVRGNSPLLDYMAVTQHN